MLDPVTVAEEPFVICKLPQVDGFTVTPKLTIIVHGNDQVPVFSNKTLVGHYIGMGVTQPGRIKTTHQVIRGLIGKGGGGHIQQSEVYMLAKARMLALSPICLIV